MIGTNAKGNKESVIHQTLGALTHMSRGILYVLVNIFIASSYQQRYVLSTISNDLFQFKTIKTHWNPWGYGITRDI